MVAWFLVAIGTIGLFAYIAYAGVGTVDTVGSHVSRAETVRRVELVSRSLLSRAASPFDDGVVYLPAGIVDGGFHRLPADLQSAGRTTDGSLFQYCPMGQPLRTGETSNATVSYPGGSYGVVTASLNDRSFVTRGRLQAVPGADLDVMGFVMAPLDSGQTISGCGQIVLTGDAYTAPNAIVRAIRRSTAMDVVSNRASSGSTWYVTSAGGGTGQSWSNPASLETALAAYRDSPGGNFTIRIAPSAGAFFFLPGTPLDQTTTQMAPKSPGSTLTIVSSGRPILYMGRIDVPSDLDVKGVDLSYFAINGSMGRTIRMQDAVVGQVTLATNSRLLVGNNTTFTSFLGGTLLTAGPGSSVSMTGAVNMTHPSGGSGISMASGSSLSVVDSTLSISMSGRFGMGSTSINLGSGSNSVFRTSTVSLNARSMIGVFLSGDLSMQSVALAFNGNQEVGFMASNGSSLNLDASVVGGFSPPRTTIVANAAAKMTGTADLASRFRCWSATNDGFLANGQSLFRMSPDGRTGAISSVMADEALPALSDMPTQAEIQAYERVRSTNLQKADIRSRLSPGGAYYTCRQSA